MADMAKDLLIGVYPGTFDPITFGHMDIISRGMNVVDKMIIAVAKNAGKNPLFSMEERAEIAREEIQGLLQKLDPLPDGSPRIEIQIFDRLLIDFTRDVGARVIIRGLRAVSDFEYEFKMAGMNAHLNRDIETLFLMASDKYQLISSRFVKEIARLGGNVEKFVSPFVLKKLTDRFAEDRESQAKAKQTPPFE